MTEFIGFSRIPGAANVGKMIRAIKALTEKEGFYDKVREIVGFNDPSVFIEDWDIKKLQRVADAKYAELCEGGAS